MAERPRSRAHRLAHLLDESIRLPGGFRIGLDGLMGLVPGIGDAAGLVASSYILFVAIRQGVPPTALARMLGNVLLETTIGVVPIVGDAFDFYWRANTRNVRILDAHADPDRSRRERRRNRRGALVLAASVGVLLLLGAVWGAVALVAWLFSPGG